MNLEEYHKEEKIFTMAEIQKPLLMMTLISTIVFAGGYHLIWGITIWDHVEKYAVVSILYVVLIPIHELIHGVAFKFIGRIPWENISYGIIWKSLTPYAHCKKPISINAYKSAVLLPMIITGILPLVAGFIMGNGFLTVLGVLMTQAGFGDVLIYWHIRNYDEHTVIKDHPEKIGCEVYSMKKAVDMG
jgi:hypothetical protein